MPVCSVTNMQKIIFCRTVIFTVILACVLGHHCESSKSFGYSDKWETTIMVTVQAVDMGFMVRVMAHHKQGCRRMTFSLGQEQEFSYLGQFVEYNHNIYH
jgi:hypothetical protein